MVCPCPVHHPYRSQRLPGISLVHGELLSGTYAPHKLINVLRVSLPTRICEISRKSILWPKLIYLRMYTASAFSVITIIRSCVGGAFPLFTTQVSWIYYFNLVLLNQNCCTDVQWHGHSLGLHSPRINLVDPGSNAPIILQIRSHITCKEQVCSWLGKLLFFGVCDQQANLHRIWLWPKS